MLTPEDRQRLAEIGARNEARTPGEWVYVAGILKHYICGGVFTTAHGEEYDELRLSIQEMHWEDGHETRAAADAEFIAKNTLDVPYLLDLVERLEKALAWYERPDYERREALRKRRLMETLTSPAGGRW